MARIPKPSSIISPSPRPSAYFKPRVPGVPAMIPGETAAGQTMLFPPNMFTSPRYTPRSEAAIKRRVMRGIKGTKPFEGGVKKRTANPKKAAKNAARKEELRAKAAAKRAQNKREAEQQAALMAGKRPKAVGVNTGFVHGPDTADVNRADELFGAVGRPVRG